MKLIMMRMLNFRQFYGESPDIHFAHGERNITVFHGTNGAGKTALLNAFTWTLFNSTTNGFQYPEQIVNLRAIEEAKVGDTISAKVELVFEHQGFKYVVKRAEEVIRTDDDPGWKNKGTGNITLELAGPDGKWLPEPRVLDTVGRILPPDLHSYFFFDGERIERIVQPTEKERADIANATKKLLGIEILDRAENHLNTARREIEKELRDAGDAETKRLLDEQGTLEDEMIEKRERLQEIDRNIDGHDARLKEIEHRLRELEETREIQARRDQLTQDLEERKKQYENLKGQLGSAVSQNGYMIFLGGAIDTFQGIIKDLHDRGELPSGIKRNFVEALLKDKTCICSRELKNGSDSRMAVESWMKKAGLGDVEEKAIRMDGSVDQIARSIPQFLESVDKIQRQTDSARRAISQIEEELDDIKAQLTKSPKEEISELEQQYERTHRTIRNLGEEKGKIREQINVMEEKVNELKNSIKQLQVKEQRQELLQRQIAAANDAKERITCIRKLYEDDFRAGLLKKVISLFSEISPTPYVPDLTREYALRLLNSFGEKSVPVAASEGENQILSLAFIGSIIDWVREYQVKQENLLGPESSSYPLVMDSPFGKLGPIYRRQIAEHIPALADQVVIMVTETQWRGEVEQSTRKRIGSAYVLTYYSPKQNIETESIDLGNKTHDLVKISSNGFEYTEIREVEYG